MMHKKLAQKLIKYYLDLGCQLKLFTGETF